MKTIPPGARELAHCVTLSAERLHAALDALASKQPVHPHAVEINRLENQADRAHQTAVQTLFDTVTDLIAVIGPHRRATSYYIVSLVQALN